MVFTVAMQLRGVVTLYCPSLSDRWVPSRSMGVGVLGEFSWSFCLKSLAPDGEMPMTGTPVYMLGMNLILIRAAL